MVAKVTLLIAFCEKVPMLSVAGVGWCNHWLAAVCSVMEKICHGGGGAGGGWWDDGEMTVEWSWMLGMT